MTSPKSHDGEDPLTGPESHDKEDPLTDLESHDLEDSLTDPALGMFSANLNFQGLGDVLADPESLAMEDPSANLGSQMNLDEEEWIESN